MSTTHRIPTTATWLGGAVGLADTLDVACEIDLLQSPIARAVFKARELALGGTPDGRGVTVQ